MKTLPKDVVFLATAEDTKNLRSLKKITANKNTASHQQFVVKTKDPSECEKKLIKQKYKQTNCYNHISKQVPLLQTGKNVRGSFKQVVRKRS